MFRYSVSVVVLLVMLLVSCGGASSSQRPDPPGPDADPVTDVGTVEPYVVKGRVLDSRGTPLPGVEVFLSYTLGYNSNMLMTTGADGSYRFDLTGYPPGSTWYVGSYMKRQFNGDTFEFRLYPDDNSSFTAESGAIRDLPWRLSGKNPEGHDYGGTVYVYRAVNTPDIDMEYVELTLTPLELIDGSAGQEISSFLAHGMELRDVPPGTWQATARFRRDAGPALPLLISVRNKDSYSSSATGSFFAQSSYEWLLEFEIMVP